MLVVASVELGAGLSQRLRQGRLEGVEDLAPLDGVTACVRAPSVAEQGDNVLVFGRPIEASALL